MLSRAWRGLWSRCLLRGVHYRDEHSKLDALYRIRDPWNMADESEQFRFQETNRRILATFGRVRSLLEIGSGEGHQSCELLKICDSLYGMDVSERAVSRARARCPKGAFSTGDIFDTESLRNLPYVDLVMACEVIYYMSDIESVIDRLSKLGRNCMVTYYQSQASLLDPYFLKMRNCCRDEFRYNAKTWRIAWWNND